MSRKKYHYFVVATPYGNRTTSSWQTALSSYGRSESATIYGYDEFGNDYVIKSK